MRAVFAMIVGLALGLLAYYLVTRTGLFDEPPAAGSQINHVIPSESVDPSELSGYVRANQSNGTSSQMGRSTSPTRTVSPMKGD